MGRRVLLLGGGGNGVLWQFYIFIHYIYATFGGGGGAGRLLGEVVDDGFGFGGADDAGEVGFGLQAHLFDAAELEQEVAGGLFADAGDVGELRAEGAFAALVLVKGDGEAVHLVLNLFEEMEEGVGGLHSHHGRREAEEEFGSVVAVVLGEAGNGDVEVQLVLDDLASHLHLSSSAIDDKQLGKGLPLVAEALVAAVDDFGHGGVVVGAFDGLDVEFAVFLAVGLAVGEAHHGGHGVGALDVGIVEAFDVDGQHGQL